MYSVSNDYLTAIRSNVRTSKIKGIVNNTVVFTENNIEKDSCKIHQSFLGSDLSLGNTQSADFAVNIVGSTSIAKGDEITVEWGIKIAEEPVQYEWIPLGIFIVDDVQKCGFLTKISAFDKMIYFETDIELPDSAEHTPYYWLNYACTQCGVTLGITEQEMNARPNTAAYPVPIDERLRTYRELISCIGVISGCNFIIDRSGALIMIPLTLQAYVYTIYQSQMVLNGLTKKDYAVNIKGVYIVANDSTKCGDELNTDGKVIEFNNVPMLNAETNSNLAHIAENILDAVKDYQYPPFELLWQGDPALDLGDVVRFLFEDNTYFTAPIIERSFTFRNVETIGAVGTLDYQSSGSSATPSQNARDIAALHADLQNYATKAYVDAQIGEAIGDDY